MLTPPIADSRPAFAAPTPKKRQPLAVSAQPTLIVAATTDEVARDLHVVS